MYKIINKQTWGITKVDAPSKAEAIKKFKAENNLTKFDKSVYAVLEPEKKRKNYSMQSLSQFEYERKR